ncbi:glycosyltransferase family 4 protein [Brevibacillus sp. SYP-B805]|uniref:glycosyltransferase family 4 protein n=1 Tax=Brevibacillus sp. SYP-B805 TaxID=1578199 RepID=UPI0013ED233B|nr:glycosyltransferase family 4 protein [Brevibacillus sp. SYP-B805]NGQ97306.1 glycosyltransferase family 4 protein [Brevibacillus sp. SYP-B805]
MKIAIVSPGPFSVPPVKGSSVEHDIHQISRAIGPEHSVTIYARTCPTYPRSSKKENRTYVRFPYNHKPIAYIRSIIKDLRRRTPDVILVENRPHYVPYLRRAFPRIPIILNMHSHVYASKRMIAPGTMRRVMRMMDGMITNSEYLRRHFIQVHRADPSRVHAVHLGVNPTAYQPFRVEAKVRQLRQRLGLQSRHRVLFFAGRLMREKGVHLLLKTFRKISEKDPQARLLIVGGAGYGSNRMTPYVKWLHKLAEPLGSKVIFVNFVPTKEMPAWYQLADLVATPSLWQEPFCRVNLEAMAAGKPVLSTPNGGIPEVVPHQRAGFLVPATEWTVVVPQIWQSYWRSSAMRAELSSNARARAAMLSWKATAQGYLAVFQQAIARRRKRTGNGWRG